MLYHINILYIYISGYIYKIQINKDTAQHGLRQSRTLA